MKQLSAVLAVAVLAILSAAPAAHAQATRTWVSGVGDDANPCSRTAPCKTFAGAISKTAAGGEISVLDPGGFGAVTITKAITLNGDGTLAGILASGTNGVIVNAGVNDRVVLRNLSFNGAGTGLSAIRFLAGKSLLVDNVTISGFTSRGIDVSLSGSADVGVKDTTITKVPTGIFVNTSSGLALATLEHVHLQGLTNGVEASNGRINVSNSDITDNSSNGILASSAASVINVNNCLVAFNALTGINASVSGSLIRISNNDIENNTTGISIAAGGTVSSAGNNRVVGNGGTTAPNGAAIPIQ
jgi:Right handed beta helix region